MTSRLVSVAKSKGSYVRRQPDQVEPLCGYECDPSRIHCAVWTQPEFIGSAVLQMCDEYIGSGDEDKIELGKQGVRELCASFNETTLARLESQAHKKALEEMSELARTKTEFVNRLLIDQNTGLLTGSALHELEARLYEDGALHKLKNDGVEIRLLVLDINDLKVHNSVTENQGDAAIAAIGAKLRRLYARDADFVGIEHIHEEAEKSLEVITGEGIAARSHGRGDEFVVYTFISPNDAIRSHSNIYRELERLHEELSSVSYEFEGKTYQIGVAFGIAEFQIPDTLEELRAYKQSVDEFMRELKDVRKIPGGPLTFGDVVKLELD